MKIIHEFKPYHVYVKYDHAYPYLPIAIADTIPELARQLGVTANTIYSSMSHGRKTYQKVYYDPDMYPDNDGNLWFKDPLTGEHVLWIDD